MTRVQAQGWFQGYAEAFDSFDAGATADHFDVPCTIVGRSYVVALNTRAEVVENFEGVNETHRELGYHCAKLEECSVIPTYAEEVVEARTTWAFLKKDGSLIYRFRMIYFPTKLDGIWKIAVAVNVDDELRERT